MWLSEIRYKLVKMELEMTESSSSADSTPKESTSGAFSTKNGELQEKSFSELGQVPYLFRSKVKDYQDQNSYRKVTLAWQDLSVYVPIKKEGFFGGGGERHRQFKRVLNNIYGIVRPGDLLAIMGSSGSGKSTLLEVLAYRSPGIVLVLDQLIANLNLSVEFPEYISIEGDIKANGKRVGKFMKYISGFVYQNDLFTKTLTVSEHLHFMAIMKLDRRLGSWERIRRIEELLNELSLKKCEKTRISDLSGGEKKRLAFASEVLTDPPLLFIDEPTTGLDAFSALRIVGMMRGLAARGKSILTTIHQPSSQLFSMFDKLCLLAEGRMAYMGSAKGAKSFLEDMNLICPEQFNPADWYIRCLAVYPGREKESRRIIKEICDRFTLSSEGRDLEENVQKEFDLFNISIRSKRSSITSMSSTDQYMENYKARKPFWWTQAIWLSKRSLRNSYRNPDVHITRSIQKIVIAFLIGLCYFGVTHDQEGIQDIEGAIFVLITESTFPSMYGTLHIFPTELPLFIRESKNGLYPVGAYYFSKIIEALPGFILEPIIFGTIAYWLIGLRPTLSAYLLSILMVIITSNTAASCGMFFSSAFDHVNQAITALIPFDYILMITGGFFINLGTMPPYASWLKFLSWFMYSNEALSIIQWKGVQNISCETNPNYPCIMTGDGVLESKSFADWHLYYDFMAMGVLYTFFHVMAYFSLLFKVHKK